MKLDLVADMEVDKVADKVADKEADMEVDKVANMFKTKCLKSDMFWNKVHNGPKLFDAKSTRVECLLKALRVYS